MPLWLQPFKVATHEVMVRSVAWSQSGAHLSVGLHSGKVLKTLSCRYTMRLLEKSAAVLLNLHPAACQAVVPLIVALCLC